MPAARLDQPVGADTAHPGRCQHRRLHHPSGTAATERRPRPAPAELPAAGRGPANAWGVRDLHGVVWEWTLDFNSALVSGESRADASLERSLYCGAGASGATDFADYAAFMRFAHRASLEADYTTALLGFRTARSLRVTAEQAR